jgi:hypothetical protein
MTEKKIETWRNVTQARHYIKFNKNGELVNQMIMPDKSFHITPEERRFNSELAAGPELDVFANGTFAPVRLIEDEDDTAEIANNPNLLGESDMEALFKAHYKTFDAKVAEISNLLTLERMVEVGRQQDASVRKIETIQARIAELTPAKHFAEVEQLGNVEATQLRPPVTPR